MMDDRIKKERKFWDAFALKYDRFVEDKAGRLYEQLLGLLLEDTCQTQNLLEVATGTGLISFRLSSRIPSIKAIDLSPEMIQIAQEKAVQKSISHIEFRIEDACSLSFSDHSFDTVIASNVLHLLFDPEQAMLQMKRVLHKKGLLIIPTYCHGENLRSHFFSRCMNLMGFRARRRWSIDSFQRFVSQCGFDVIKTQTLPGVIPMLYLVAKPNV